MEYKLNSFKGEWLDVIPSAWEQIKIKNIFQIKKIIVGEVGYEVISITQDGAKIKDIESGGGQISMDYSKYQLVEKGDFLMNHMDLLTGYIDISDFHGVTSPDYRVFSLINSKCLPRYYLYLFQYLYKSKIFYGYGRGVSKFGRWRLPTKEFNNFYVCKPSIEEQDLISKYLDKKIKIIDLYHEKIKRKNDLLNEIKNSLIKKCVTKGINEKVELKDSGIEWIGKIPKHWRVRKLKHFFNYKKGSYGQKLTATYIDENKGNYPVFSGQTEKGGVLGYWNEYEFNFNKNVIFCTTVGAKLMTTKVITGKFSLSQNCLLLIPKKEELIINYINFFFKYDFQIRRELLPCIIQPSLRMEDLDQYYLLIPPKEEQEKILEFINKKVKQIDQYIDICIRKSNILKKYRDSLISSTVTGKIRITGDML